MNDRPQSAPRKAGLSICMPVYNKGKLLPRTLASIQRQNIADLEIVAVDNGSKDDSRKILESSRSCQDSRIFRESSLLPLSTATISRSAMFCRWIEARVRGSSRALL